MGYGTPVIETFVGATGRVLTFYITDPDGNAVDLTGYIAAKLSADLGGTVKISGATMTIADAANGKVTYQPQAAEIDTAGDMNANVRLEATGGIDYSESFIIRVNPVVDHA